ncbi:MAG: YdcF family protein [Oscillospiraceae bacterium]|jgi:uncharacterized SAM-binding protein YcdF (DUF218 family)|nr:YdcF family protein [Oscillospiraceae bacterium]
MKKLPVLLAVLAVGLGLIAAAGLGYGLGLAVLPAIAAAAVVVAAVAFQLLSRRAPRFYKVAARVTASLVCAALLACAVASAQIISRYYDDADIPEDAAVIVLGCGLSPVDHTLPSVMLAGRLRAAETYIKAHPGCDVILSGGQGPNERVSEAEAMRRWLDARGGDMSRVFLEDGSSSTGENLEFSIALARENGIDLSLGVVIVTDGFHEFRAQRLAKQLGLTPYTASSRTPYFALKAFYWAREIAAIMFQVWL